MEITQLLVQSQLKTSAILISQVGGDSVDFPRGALEVLKTVPTLTSTFMFSKLHHHLECRWS